LKGANTTTKADPEYPLAFVKHRLNVVLIHDATGAFAYPTCGEARALRFFSVIDVIVGDWKTFLAPDGQRDHQRCSLPRQNGVYTLMYVLDPNNIWAEGTAGESNNIGFFDGFYYVNEN
jgi:hypothetical protein